jgi:glycosyltransferase involved in cell wall biosynthesis
MRRIVSITPLAVERDSRTFTHAASMARLGYESIVVEAEPSGPDRDRLPFELITIDPPETAEKQLRRRSRLVVASCRKLAPSPLNWMIGWLWRWGPVSATAVPPASLYYLTGRRPYPAVYLARRSQSVPFIYDAQDFYQGLQPPGQPPAERATRDYRARQRFLLGVERHCARHAAEVVVPSEGVADLFAAEFRRRPVVIPNAHDPRIDHDLPTRLREELGLDSSAMLIAVSGNVRKGVAMEAIIEAIERLPENVHLALIGRGYEPYVSRIESRSLGGRVHRLPAVPYDQYAGLISGADLALIPYVAYSAALRHTVPSRFFISIAAGVPVLYPEQLTDLARMVVAHDVGLPIDPQRPESIVSAVHQVLEDEALLARLRQNARRAGEALSWKSQEQGLGEVIERALDRKAR